MIDESEMIDTIETPEIKDYLDDIFGTNSGTDDEDAGQDESTQSVRRSSRIAKRKLSFGKNFFKLNIDIF